jgi:sulfur carrier protein ThiS adenylyltransferase
MVDNMNDFEKALSHILGKENLANIQKVKVGMAGAGGLGSNCSMYLVRCGFKRFRIVDSDIVEMSNLNRQFYFAAQVGRKKVEALRENLLMINTQLEVEVHNKRITSDNIEVLFADCDVVVEALDGAADKKMVAETYMNSRKLIVAASGIAGWGRSDDITIRRIRNNFYMVGDLTSESAPACPPIAPRVNVAAAKQADVIVSYVLENPRGGKHDTR